MKFVKFSGSTPFLGTDYEDYMVYCDDTPEDAITMQSQGYAIDNGRRFDRLIKSEMKLLPETEKNLFYLNYLQKCLDRSSWEYISETEFNVALEEQG